MRIEQIIELLTMAAKGRDNIKLGAVGSNGYGFIFKDFKYPPQEPFITHYGSSKFCGAGTHRNFLKDLGKQNRKDFSDLFLYDIRSDLLFAGSLRTLIPNLQFGGTDVFFEAWILIMTPKNQIFPATFYWGQSGLSIGGWMSYRVSPFMRKKVFSENFLKFINFSPFEFTEDEKGCFLDAFEFALKKVPPADFWGVYSHDLGNSLMELRRGRPFIRELGYFKYDPNAEKELEPLLERKFKDEYCESFTIRLLPRMGKYIRLYAMEFEYPYEGVDKLFGDAKKMLELYHDFVKL